MEAVTSGVIDREMFFLHLGTWLAGKRAAHVTMGDGKVLDGIVEAVDPAKSQLTLLCDNIPETLDFSTADNFVYLDYNDPDEQMAEYFEAGFPAWMRAYAGSELMASLLLKND